MKKLCFFILYLEYNELIDYLIFFSIKRNKNPINVAFYNRVMLKGGLERVTSILLNYFQKEKSFVFYLITFSKKLEGEFEIPKNIERISLNNEFNKLFEIIKEKHIDILIYNKDVKKEIQKLNRLNNTKVIFCLHASFFYSIYKHLYNLEETIYKYYKKSKYVISLVPIENDYLFKKWGINSVLIENPCTFEYDLVTPSDLSKKNIIMIGRGNFKFKRFELGIKAMSFIVKEIPECKMFIISHPYKNINSCIYNLNLQLNVKVVGALTNPESYLKNSSLHIFPSLTEAFPMVLGEVKIFGIPTILCGLDYLILSKGGTVIIYDDNPLSIAKEAIKILNDYKYRKKLGKEARKSMKRIKNTLIIKKWIKLLFNVYNGIDKLSFSKLFTNYNKLVTEKEANIILKNQMILLKRRIPSLSKLTLDKLESYSFK